MQAMAVDEEWRRWIKACGGRYFDGLDAEIAALQVPRCDGQVTFDIVDVPLPAWMAEFGPTAPRTIPVDRCCLIDGEGPPEARCDWWRAAFLMLSAAYERDFEARNGPVHSYRLRLPRAWDAIFRRPWVNWIFLLLARKATARAVAVPRPEFYLTHDVDAVAKTVPTRAKQAAFNSLNAARQLARGRAGESLGALGKALRMALLPADYWQFERILAMEDARGLRSTWNFYGGKGGWLRSPRHILMDPMYDVASPAITSLLRRLIGEGWDVGLHQAFDSWASCEPMRAEAAALASASGRIVTRCRQHWLRFSFARTWAAQAEAGIELDTTIGFNDASGFRLGAALAIAPWDGDSGRLHALTSVPLVLMDSHLHDYGLLDEAEIRAEITRVVDEVKAVGGVASLLWHQRVMHPDYGWAWSYETLLDRLAGEGFACR
ncbi:MAG: hypothetical protein R3F54_17335 [Alphaproteobacteria bacterium]